MTKVIATKSANRFTVQFADGKTYAAFIETVNGRPMAVFATSCHRKPKSYDLCRNSKLLTKLTDAINA
jgi:hypothetical protein